MPLVRCRGCKVRVERESAIRLHLGWACSKDCLDRIRRDAQHRSRKTTRPSWASEVDLRRQIRTRDGFRCRSCGRHTALHVHHITYRSQGGSNEAHNLITLCETHHSEAHADPRRYQPLLRGVIWKLYVEGVSTTVPQLERWLITTTSVPG